MGYLYAQSVYCLIYGQTKSKNHNKINNLRRDQVGATTGYSLLYNPFKGENYTLGAEFFLRAALIDWRWWC